MLCYVMLVQYGKYSILFYFMICTVPRKQAVERIRKYHATPHKQFVSGGTHLGSDIVT
jgi:hypothetical protein